MSSDLELLGLVGKFFSLVGWLILVIPIYSILSSIRRTNEILEAIAKMMATASAPISRNIAEQPETPNSLHSAGLAAAERWKR